MSSAVGILQNNNPLRSLRCDPCRPSNAKIRYQGSTITNE